jgi:predicted DNA-binding transcriptional regulator AlpA
MSRRPYPPDYVSRETLAYRLDLRAGDVDRMVTAGLLPQPVLVGNEQRWRWSDVEARLATGSEPRHDDPYMRGVENAGQTAPLRQGRQIARA